MASSENTPIGLNAEEAELVFGILAAEFDLDVKYRPPFIDNCTDGTTEKLAFLGHSRHLLSGELGVFAIVAGPLIVCDDKPTLAKMMAAAEATKLLVAALGQEAPLLAADTGPRSRPSALAEVGALGSLDSSHSRFVVV